MPEIATNKLHRFFGGLYLEPQKTLQTARPLRELPLPSRVHIPMSQHRGLPATPCVTSGQKVRKGDLIGRANGMLSANVHASVSGTIGAIQSRLTARPIAVPSLCVEIIADEEQSANRDCRIAHDFHLEAPNNLRLKVAEAGIVGLGGAVFPTALKLAAEADRHLRTLVINGAECEPYMSCDETLMREHAVEIIRGVQIMLHILQINEAWLAIEEDKQAAIAAMSAALEQISDERLQLCLVHARYPEGGERQLIQVLSGQEVPSDGLPIDIGFLCHNVATAYAVFDALENGHALSSRIVSVGGSGVAEPQNVRVPVGTSIRDVINCCGGYSHDEVRIIIGGAMMGFTLVSDEIPVDKGTNCILVMPESESRAHQPVMPCIRCGDCANVCPANLLPQQLYWHAHGERLKEVKRLHVGDCIECGLCDYVCPSNLPLTQYFRHAKDTLWRQEAQLASASIARTRFENREHRLHHLQQQRETQRAVRKRALHDQTERDTAIQAAVARASAKKRALDEDKAE